MNTKDYKVFEIIEKDMLFLKEKQDFHFENIRMITDFINKINELDKRLETLEKHTYES